MGSSGLRVSMALLAATVIATGCAQESLTFDAIQLGRGLNADRTVTNFATRFKPTDTIYVAVLTAGGGSGTVKARWLSLMTRPAFPIRRQIGSQSSLLSSLLTSLPTPTCRRMVGRTP
jgi:hypothetical protein